jgi:flavin reductase (DIM6/NTAB) family NADH-FMN oxidoreductase RutF
MRQTIPVHEFTTPIFRQWDKGWFLLTAGDFAADNYNTMTVSWGAMGGLWGRPFVQVVVRPQRYTYGFMERHDTFTLSAFPEAYRKALDLLGAKSGRDGDKIAESGLTPVASTRVAAPSFAEAELVIECRKIYWDDLEPGHFLSSDIGRNYPIRDYHRVYYGEIVTIEGEDAYRR